MKLEKNDYYVFILIILCILLTIHNLNLTNTYNHLVSHIESNFVLVPKINSEYQNIFNLPEGLINITKDVIENETG